MFALLALAGDLGCSAGPSLVGFVSDAADGNLRLACLRRFAFLCCYCAGWQCTNKWREMWGAV